MLLRIHEVEQQGFKEIVVTLCDEGLLGKSLGKGFFVNPRFYGGEERLEDDAVKIVKGASIVNAVGKDSIDFLMKNGLISEENVGKVGEVPHAQIVVVEK